MKLIDRIIKNTSGAGDTPFCTAVVPAAGSSTRMGGENKILMDIAGKPLIVRTLEVLQSAESINEIVVVTREDSIVPIADICARYGFDKVTKVVCGGKERSDSVLIGAMEASSKAELIAVHDGARPLVTVQIVNDTVEKASKFKAAAPAVAVNDTIKTVKNSYVSSTVDRSTLAAVQTPQVFNADILKAALQNAKDKGLKITDDCSAVEAIGGTIYLTKGSYENIKITTAYDVICAEAVLKARESRV